MLDTSNLPQIEQINTPNGRFYVTPEGNRYPSVTTITSLINEKAIAAWRAKVGYETANKISREASNKGTRFHELMEHTLLTNDTSKIVMYSEFGRVYPQILQKVIPYIDEVMLVEQRMYSDIVRCAGTVDLVAKYHGKVCICDWKTSRHHKTPDMVKNYWLQTAAYAIMLKERFDIEAEKLVLFVNEGDKDFYIMTQPVEPWLEPFARLRAYYDQVRG